jgi:MmeI, N-terminal domain
LVAADLGSGDALDIEIEELKGDIAFFLPWAGIEKTQIENLNLADVKAAEKMAKL